MPTRLYHCRRKYLAVLGVDGLRNPWGNSVGAFGKLEVLSGKFQYKSKDTNTMKPQAAVRRGLPARNAGLVPMVMFAAALCFGSVESARGQSPASEGGQADAQPVAEAAASSAREENESALAPEAAPPPEPPLSESELWAQRLKELIAGLEAFERRPEEADALYAELTPALQARRQELRKALGWARSPEALIEVTPDQKAPEATQGKPVTGPAESAVTTRTDAEASAGISAEEAVSGVSAEDQDTATPVDESAVDVAETKIADEVQTLAELHDTVVALYRTRIVVLQYVTPELRARVTGVGLTGVRELLGEITQLILDTRYKAVLIPAQVAAWPEMVRKAPLPLVFGVVKLVIALIIFRWWGRWAPGALMRLRDMLLAARPRRRRNLRLARFLWYLDRVRRPLEWLALLAVLVALVDMPDLEKAPWTVAQWFLLTWFAVALIDSAVARGATRLSVKTARLRLGSLRLVAAWLVLLGLGLELATVYVGRGTIHAWVWLLFEVLTLPLLFLLIILWRSHVFRELDAAARLPAWVERMLEHRRGLNNFASAAVGGLYLIGVSLWRSLLDAISEMDWGRRVQAHLNTREMARARKRQQDVGEPISAELRDRLIAGPGRLVEKIARSELMQLVKLVDSGHGRQAIIIAERGGGKTTLLQRLASRFNGQALVIDCPVEGYQAFLEVFAKALELNAAEASPEAFGRRLTQSKIRVVAFDNVHHLIRPMKGGQKDWDQVAKFIRAIWGNIVWVFAVDRAAWQYTSLMRGERLFLGVVLELPHLTEEQLGDLIDLRCTEVGIRPDFTKLLLPRQSDGTDQETAAQRYRLGFIRFLWRASDGNPEVALRLWAESLVTQEDGGHEVRLPEQPALAELERLGITGLLVLRVVAQCELASPEDITQSLKLPEAVVQGAITALLQHGWIEELDGRYRISWPWWRTITRVLARKNLLPRSL